VRAEASQVGIAPFLDATRGTSTGGHLVPVELDAVVPRCLEKASRALPAR